jgi:hypothetical protein
MLAPKKTYDKERKLLNVFSFKIYFLINIKYSHQLLLSKNKSNTLLSQKNKNKIIYIYIYNDFFIAEAKFEK